MLFMATQLLSDDLNTKCRQVHVLNKLYCHWKVVSLNLAGKRKSLLLKTCDGNSRGTFEEPSRNIRRGCDEHAGKLCKRQITVQNAHLFWNPKKRLPQGIPLLNRNSANLARCLSAGIRLMVVRVENK